MKLFGTMSVVDNMLEIGGVSMKTLKETYGTPLYIYDEVLLRETASLFVDSFKGKTLEGVVAYASKAFLSIAMAQLATQEGLAIDVASAGELFTVHKSGFDMSRVYFHGNNKLREELELAVELNCGVIVLDHRNEVSLLESVLQEKGATMNVLLRVNPGIDAHTHEYIKTTTLDSKFGESLFDPEIMNVIQSINDSVSLNFLGLHCHIGSQIFEQESFHKAADEILEFYKRVLDETGIRFTEVNLGGGFGVYYTKGDKPVTLDTFLPELMDHVETVVEALGLGIKRVIIEPGRSIVCNAGSTLYTVGSEKLTMSGKRYAYIDGGMSDNIRPALYQAEYEAGIANKMDQASNTDYCVAGKLCESGDVIINSVKLPHVERDDLLLVPSTGAYTYSMSSNYNKLTRPAVVFVRDGHHQLVVRRQSLNDLTQWDLNL